MAKPWEKYQTAQPVSEKKPWEKHAKQSAQPAKAINAHDEIDYLEGYNVPQRMLIGAGKSAVELLAGLGIGEVDPNGPGMQAISDDTAGMVGGGLAQAGMMYAGGAALKSAGGLMTAAKSVPLVGKAANAVGNAAKWIGTGATNPAGYKQAATAGAMFGAASKPGDAAERITNAAAGGIGGAAGLAIGRGIQSAGGAIGGLLKGAKGEATLEQQVSAKLSAKGIDLHALPRAIQDQIKNAGKQSLDVLDDLKPEELARMADFNALNIKPTKGWVTRDPNAWWHENTLNTVNDDIAARFKDANQTLLQSVKKGAPDATDYQIGQRLSDTISGHDAAMKANVDGLYKAARETAGRDIPLDAHRFVNDASIDLDRQMIGSKLPGDTLSWFQKITNGKEPFDMGTAMQRLQAINGRIYSTSDDAEAKALGIVKSHLVNALDDYSAQGGSNAVIGGANAEQAGLSQAFRAARTAAADRFKFQDSSPIVDKVLSGKYTPEQLPDVIGRMRVDDLASLAKLQKDRGVPVMGAMQDAAKAFIRDSATLQGETGGAFTVNGMRKALDKIGPEKGKMLFGSDGWEGYQQILRAAGNINNAPLKPAGSSTASNALRVIQKVKVPGVSQGLELMVSGAGKAHQMMEINGLLNPKATIPEIAKKQSMLPLLAVPSLLGVSSSSQSR